MRHLIKFLHTLGAIGMMGAMACLLVLLAFLPEPMRLSDYASMRAAMGAVAGWIFLPSLALTLVAGLFGDGRHVGLPSGFPHYAAALRRNPPTASISRRSHSGAMS
jgi:hypothetical protein